MNDSLDFWQDLNFSGYKEGHFEINAPQAS